MYNGRCFLSSPPTGSPHAWRSWSFSAKDSEGQSTHAKLAHAKLSTCTSQIVIAIYLFTRATMEIGEIRNHRYYELLTLKWFISGDLFLSDELDFGCSGALPTRMFSLLMSFIFSRLRLAIPRYAPKNSFASCRSPTKCGRGRTLILRNCRVEGCSQ